MIRLNCANHTPIKIKKNEWTCKPNSVSSDHSSWAHISACLTQPTRKLQAGHLLVSSRFFPIWSFSERGLPCPSVLPHWAVVSYTTFSPLPEFFNTRKLRRFVFCGTFRCLATPGRYPALCPVEFGLSSCLSRKKNKRPLSPLASLL